MAAFLVVSGVVELGHVRNVSSEAVVAVIVVVVVMCAVSMIAGVEFGQVRNVSSEAMVSTEMRWR